MPNVFLSYRHVKPDQELASLLADRLKSAAYSVFLDVDIRVGHDWVGAIENALLRADYFVVLLSPQSIGSDMLRQEVKLAHKYGKHILPICLDLPGDLPYDLASYLHRSQRLFWNAQMGLNELAMRVCDAIPQTESPGELQAPDILYKDDARTNQLAPPLPSADPRRVDGFESGTLHLGSPFYVRRASDEEAEQCLESAIPTTIIKAPRQMGKSSLLARLHAQAQRLGRKSFYIDFQLVDDSHLATLDALFRRLARQLHRAFGTALDPRAVWDDLDGPKGNITNYLDDAILARAQMPVHLIFDEAERLFSFPYRDEFFAIIRGWHNLRATNSRFLNCCVVIGHATTPALWIRDINQSPFNVGYSIALRGFTESQVSELNARHGHPLRDEAEISELDDLLGGHAYLTRFALYTLAKRRCRLSDLVNTLDDQSGPFADHLRGLMWALANTPDLRDTLRAILKGHGCDNELHYQLLWAAGLISGQTRGQARARCRLYDSYFRRHL